MVVDTMLDKHLCGYRLDGVRQGIKEGRISTWDALLTASCDAITESIDDELGTQHRQREEAITIVYGVAPLVRLFGSMYVVSLFEDADAW